MPQEFDYDILNAGPLVLFTPLNDDAKQWWKESCEAGWVTGKDYVVDQSCAESIVNGLVDAGYRLRIS